MAVERFELPTRGFGIRCSAASGATPKTFYYFNSKKPRTGRGYRISGGVDGTRTRDPRRDRPVAPATELPLRSGQLTK